MRCRIRAGLGILALCLGMALPEAGYCSDGDGPEALSPSEGNWFIRTYDAKAALLRDGSPIMEGKSESSDQVGRADGPCRASILEECGDGWMYIESGDVRGFVSQDDLVPEMVSDVLVNIGRDGYGTASATVPAYENSALTYSLLTAKNIRAKKVCALAKRGDTRIRETEDAGSRTVGEMGKGGLCYILEDEGDGTVYVESGDVRGFTSKASLFTGAVAETVTGSSGEGSFPAAEATVPPSENKAFYHTLLSVNEGDPSILLRGKLVEYALQFVGNPYVWGGTSLTDGADCSGFAQSVYAEFGYSLPRVASDQSVCGTRVPVSEAQPGDLIFYAKGGYVYHVSIYIGDGQVVHANTSATGITTSGIAGDAAWAVNLIG